MRKTVPRRWKVATSFWQNIWSLLAPGGIVIVTNIPMHRNKTYIYIYTHFLLVGGTDGLCLQALFDGYGCDCKAPLPGTVCSRHKTLQADICWDEDIGKQLLFDSFIKLTKREGLRMTRPAYFDNKGKMGVVLERMERVT
mmetsp:Transcript_7590/g.18545  ORF Transcript_7590/g.18545 Transcript_7590/m.18545 type:complete len:140 (-) Transcript_7590:703-1122(-)